MAVTGNDFLVFAETCLKEDSEINRRMSVGRSYYGMYHSVLSIITQPIPNYSGGGCHYKLIEHLQDRNSGEPYDSSKLRRLSYILRQSKSFRADADYEIDSDCISFELAEEQLAQACKVSGICQELTEKAA